MCCKVHNWPYLLTIEVHVKALCTHTARGIKPLLSLLVLAKSEHLVSIWSPGWERELFLPWTALSWALKYWGFKKRGIHVDVLKGSSVPCSPQSPKKDSFLSSEVILRDWESLVWFVMYRSLQGITGVSAGNCLCFVDILGLCCLHNSPLDRWFPTMFLERSLHYTLCLSSGLIVSTNVLMTSVLD